MKVTYIWRENLISALSFAIDRAKGTYLDGSILQKGWEENLKELKEGSDIKLYDNERKW